MSTTVINPQVEVGHDAHERAGMLKKRFLVTTPLGVIIMVLSMVPALQFPGWQWLVGALALPVITWGAWPFHVAAARAARHGATTMDTLVSMGIIASSLWSYWALFWGGAGEIGMKMHMSLLPSTTHTGSHADIYFEAAAMITVFLLGGRWAEAATRYRAGDALRSLLNLGAKEATLLIPPTSQVANPGNTPSDTAFGDYQEKSIPAAQLRVGDLFLVRPGDKVPTDGEVVQGNSALDASLLTGESVPVDVSEGDPVTGATLNTWGSLVVRATRVGEETTLAQIGRMVTEAQSGHAPVQRLADRVSAIFVPIVIGISFVTLVVWLLLSHDIQASFTAAVAVLVVACPCALGLATPTALLVGSGRASQLGIIIRNAEVLEQTRTVNVAALDKTGTITTGEMKVIASLPDSETLARGAAVEAHSEHPLARAICAQARKDNPDGTLLPTTDFSNHAGSGVSARAEGKLWVVGSPAWLATHGVALPESLQSAATRYQNEGATLVAVISLPEQSLSTPQSADTSLASTASAATKDDPSPFGIKVNLKIEGMTCASCVNRIERKLKKLPGVDAQVNLATDSATVTLSEDHSDSDLIKVIEGAGYGAQVISRRLEPLPGTSTSDPNPAALAGAPAQKAGRALPEKFTDFAVIGIIALQDTPKQTSAAAIAEMKAMGIEPILLSGDNENAARHVAEEVGISQVIAGVRPEEKQKEIARLQQGGATVAMIGDGVNDAAALAQASNHGVGIAMGSGTDAAIAVADITLVNSDLRSVPRALRISRQTLKVIKENLFWAFFYNALAIPLACAGLLNPMIAAAAMAFSSVFVVANSLRLRRAG